MTRELIIMRGLPGCGKTTWAQKHYPDAQHCSADNFFETALEDGSTEYRFNPAKMAEAHSQCLDLVLMAMKFGAPQIVVDNTNIHNWEFSKYVLAAKLAPYMTTIVEDVPLTFGLARRCAQQCTHGVPCDVIARMGFEWEDISPDLIALGGINVVAMDYWKPSRN